MTKLMYKRWDNVKIVQAPHGRYVRDNYLGQVGIVTEVTESVLIGESWVFIVALPDGRMLSVTKDYLELAVDED